MKFLVVFVLLMFSSVLYGQDTLIFNSGRILPARVTALDTISKLVYSIEQNDTIVRSTLLLISMKLHSTDIIYIVRDKNEDHLDVNEKEVLHKINWLKRPSRFQYGGTSLGLNPMAAFNTLRYSTPSGNGVLAFHVEQRLSPRISLRFPVRIGLFKSEKGITYSGPGLMPKAEINLYSNNTIAEAGIEFLPYLNNFKHVNFYCSAGFHGGINKGANLEKVTSINNHHIYDYSSGQWDTTIWYRNHYTPGRTYSYLRFSFSLGLKRCISERYLIGFELGIFGSNAIGHVNSLTTVEESNNGTDYETISSQESTEPIITLKYGYQGAINLIYNFKPRSKTQLK